MRRFLAARVTGVGCECMIERLAIDVLRMRRHAAPQLKKIAVKAA